MSQVEKEIKPLQILIAEDDPDDQFIFETAFREIVPDTALRFFYTSQGLIQHLVSTGIQNESESLPDMIIGDMKLPFFELKDIAEIRTYKQFEKIPVYVFAEGYADVTRTNALALGATNFYHKPNSLHTLKTILQEIIANQSSPFVIVNDDPTKLGDNSLETAVTEE